MELHKIDHVIPLSENRLKVCFENGEKKTYDVSTIYKKWPVFSALKEKALFCKVRKDDTGYGVIWNNELDLSSEELYYNGEKLRE